MTYFEGPTSSAKGPATLKKRGPNPGSEEQAQYRISSARCSGQVFANKRKPIRSLAHHGHATVLSIVFRSAVRLACLLHGDCFGGHRFNAFRRAAAYPKLDRSLVTAFPSPATAPAFADSIPGSKVPACYFACLAYRLQCPFGHSAPLPELVCPNSRRFHASSPLHFRPQAHPAALPISTPLREFSLPRDQSVQWALLPSGPPSESARSPLAPRSRFYH
jgi:hypothetical protein